MAEDRKREQVLPPGTYAYVLDGTKGLVRIHVGPIVINQTNQDTPVVYNHKTHRFDPCTLDQAVTQNIVVPEAFYAVLTNPAKSREGRDLHPEIGRLQDSPDLLIGQKENIPGPVNFALFPGQSAEVRRGHHLRSNQYLRVKIYNEDKARENWSKAVVKTVSEVPGASLGPESIVTRSAPRDLTVGKQYNILGTEVSFYIPPTGVSVVPDGLGGDGKADFVRDAETLEQLEYAILVDEDGNKEYPRGPMVVFPKPTQQFLTDARGNRKFRAIEMNELQGIQLKFITSVEVTLADGTKRAFKAGEETFITGKEMPIYYPEEGHQLVKYDNRTIHYALAVPEGEARYLMDRKTGAITTVRGPTMLLPNPVTQIVVRRALSDRESMDWFPGPDGAGSKDSLAYNQWLREESSKEPTTRQGVVSERRVENKAGEAPSRGFAALDDLAQSVSRSKSVSKSPQTRGLPESRQGKSQEAVVADVAERSSTFHEPRMITFANKYKGVPTIKVRPGYAVNVVDPSGKGTVIVGPTTVLLEYGQTLDVLVLSTGLPKTTDRTKRVAYLNIANNKVSDSLEADTLDHVRVMVGLSYVVSFEGPEGRWFTIENYVKHLCDHARALVKARIQELGIEDLYARSSDFIRDTLLGVAQDGRRAGRSFAENGMRLTDVEVQWISVNDTKIGELLTKSRQQVVESSILLGQAERNLAVVKRKEELTRDEAEAKAVTTRRRLELEAEEVNNKLVLALTEIDSRWKQAERQQTASAEAQKVLDLEHQAKLTRDRLAADQLEALSRAVQDRELERLRAEVEGVVTRFSAAQSGFSEALLALRSSETLVKVAEAMSVQSIVGGKNLVDVLEQVFAGTPLQSMLGAVKQKASGNGQEKPSRP